MLDQLEGRITAQSTKEERAPKIQKNKLPKPEVNKTSLPPQATPSQDLNVPSQLFEVRVPKDVLLAVSKENGQTKEKNKKGEGKKTATSTESVKLAEGASELAVTPPKKEMLTEPGLLNKTPFVFGGSIEILEKSGQASAGSSKETISKKNKIKSIFKKESDPESKKESKKDLETSRPENENSQKVPVTPPITPTATGPIFGPVITYPIFGPVMPPACAPTMPIPPPPTFFSEPFRYLYHVSSDILHGVKHAKRALKLANDCWKLEREKKDLLRQNQQIMMRNQELQKRLNDRKEIANVEQEPIARASSSTPKDLEAKMLSQPQRRHSITAIPQQKSPQNHKSPSRKRRVVSMPPLVNINNK